MEAMSPPHGGPEIRKVLIELARYNEWATRRLFAALEAVSEDDYRRDLGLYFRSIHGTLNHLLVGEHGLWFARFAQGLCPVLALDAELEPERSRLRERLVEGAARWAPWIAALPKERLAGRLDYRSTRGEALSLPFASTLIHVFNHGTHHRGQITVALTALGQPCPTLDLVYFLVEQSQSDPDH